MNTQEALDLFLFMQNNFCKEISDILYCDFSEHIYTKWNGNILEFINRLDNINRQKILDWGYNNI